MRSARYQICEDCVGCEADDCDVVAYCLSEPGSGPCPHDRTLCEDHNLDNCPDCRRDAEQAMYRTGEYDPRADPFYRPDAKATDDAYWAQTAGFQARMRAYYTREETP